MNTFYSDAYRLAIARATTTRGVPTCCESSTRDLQRHVALARTSTIVAGVFEHHRADTALPAQTARAARRLPAPDPASPEDPADHHVFILRIVHDCSCVATW